MSQAKGVTIKLMDREFTVNCSEEERPALDSAVNYLNKKMQEISDTGNFVGTERIALMAALNISNELLTTSSDGLNVGEYKRRILSMQDDIDSAC